MKKTLLLVAIVVSLNAYAILGPIPITLNTEYRTTQPIIGSISSTIKLDRAAIEATGANTFLQLLASIPSVGLFNPQGNIPALFIRGNEAKHTLVLIDGVKVHDISSPDGATGYALEAIPLAQIQRIEIVKGPYSSLYGSGAIGGVVQIFTKKGGNRNNVNVAIGSNNSKKISFSNSFKSDKGFINFNISQYQTDGISALANNTEKDGIDNQSIGFKIGYDINENTNFSIGILKSTIDTQYDDAFGDRHNKNWHKELENINLTINHQFSDIISGQLAFAEINQNRDSFTNGVSDGFNNKKYQTKDLSLLNDIKLDNALLTVGFSKIEDKNISDNQTLSSKDIFAQWQKKLANFDVNTGMRFINHSDFGDKSVYNLGVAKNLNNGIKLTSSYGTAFNAPTLYQLFDNTYGNSNLKPETTKNVEFGIQKQNFWGDLGLKFYKNNIKNLIDAKDPANSDYSYINKNELNIKGVELSIAADIKNYLISFSHNLTDSQLNNTNQQQRRPKNTSNLTLSKTYNKFNSRLQIIKKSSSIDGTTTLDGYALVNLSTQYDYNNTTKISLDINNAFDKNYQIANDYNQLGRVINLGLKYNF